jgi:ribulose-phosphate 3-epimerase
MEIIPAILPRDFEDLEQHIGLVKGIAPTVQVDICDGRFVTNFSWPYRKHDTNFDDILSEDRGFPGWEDVNYEFDLMIANPVEDVERWITAGATRIVVHLETTDVAGIKQILEKAGELVDIGLAISIQTPIEKLWEILEAVGTTGSDDTASSVHSIKFVQCMGIRKIGYQGQEFDGRVLDRIREIHAKYPDLIVSVDGGVNLDTAEQLNEAGADRLIVGSAIFTSDNIPEAIHSFEQI